MGLNACTLEGTRFGKVAKTPVGPDRNYLFRIGGLSSIALGIGYVVIIGLYARMGGPPKGPEARLAYLAANLMPWWTIIVLSVITDLLFLPVALSLYGALKQVNRDAMVLATAFVALFIVLDLAITWTNYAVLMAVSSQYAKAVTEAQKMAAIMAADYPSRVLESSLLFAYNSLTLAIAILVTGLVMLRGAFSKPAAYLGIATGALGVLSVFGSFFGSALSFGIVFTSVLTTVWLFVIGIRLCAPGRA